MSVNSSPTEEFIETLFFVFVIFFFPLELYIYLLIESCLSQILFECMTMFPRHPCARPNTTQGAQVYCGYPKR